MKLAAPLLLAGALALSACANASDTERRAATGTAIGAGVGAGIGAISGNAGAGAAIGAGVGLLGGLVYDKTEKDKDAAYRAGVRDGRATQ